MAMCSVAPPVHPPASYYSRQYRSFSYLANPIYWAAQFQLHCGDCITVTKAYKGWSMAPNRRRHTLKNRKQWASWSDYCWREHNSERLHQSCHQKSTCLLVCVCVSVYARLVVPVVCVCVCVRFTFWSEQGFTGPWVDRSIVSGRHALSRDRIALERPRQSVFAEPVF